MSAETILSYLSQCESVDRIMYQFISQCAPVLKGIKLSNIIIVPSSFVLGIKKQLIGTGIHCVSLLSLEKKQVLMIYRYQSLQQYLRKRQVQIFLRKYGYDQFDVASVMIQLKKRYGMYGNGELVLPHEMGVLLGYPLEDVKMFIKYKGHYYKMSGYWKVYGDEKTAKEVFYQYDTVRKEAIEQLLSGWSLREIIIDK